MARIAGVNVPPNKRLVISLTYIFGVGKTLAKSICKNTKLSENVKVKDLGDKELIKLRGEIDNNFQVEGDLRRKISLNIKSEKDLRTYRGSRHIKKLPVNGQNTHCNASTRKGKRVTIAGKKQ